MKMELSVIIPAYNEADGIASVVSDVKKAMSGSGAPFEVIVVDDCSADATADKAREAGAVVVRQTTNKGYGSAIMAGIRASKYGLIATIDADMSYSASDLLKMLPFADRFDLVVGQRSGKEYRGRLLKYPARIVFRMLAEYVSGEKIPDINSGLRIFRKSEFLSLPTIHLCRGFSFSTTMTLMFLAGGFDVQFTPAEYRVRSGKSKVRYLRDTIRALQILFEIAVHYNPIKAVLPICLFPALGSVVSLVMYFLRSDHFWLLCSMISFYSALFIFAIGMVILQIRMSGNN